jgi:hypothetical protein
VVLIVAIGFHPPPPRVKPEMPTVGMRPAMIVNPVEFRNAYAWSKIIPDPASRMPVVLLNLRVLNRVMEISTPLVEENPGLVL